MDMPASIERDYAKAIGEAIKTARERRRLTQLDLGRAVNNSKNAVSNWERGVSAPTVENLRELCRALDVTPQRLLGMTAATATAKRKEGRGVSRELVSQLASLRKAAERADTDLMRALREAEKKARQVADE
jgi:transcriptional regulator with XRE-family HTH domain